MLTFFAVRDPARDRADLEARVAADPGALEARQQLVAHYVVSEDYAPALQQLAAIIEQAAEFDGGYAPLAMRRLFNLPGEDHPLVLEYRRHLRRPARRLGPAKQGRGKPEPGWTQRHRNH